MGWERKLERARRLHRPSLKNWEMDGLYEAFPEFQQSILERPPYEHFILPGNDDCPTNIPVVLDARSVDVETFCREYEAHNVPCVLTGIPERDDWSAVHEWKLENLYNNEDLRNRYFKCGEDDDGRSVKVKLKHFLKYQKHNHDDSPLYIFDSNFDEDRLAKTILQQYRVPEYFSDDLFRLVSERRRPPYRWWLVGPERSGTCIHIDPLATSAWNTLISGKKRWVLFPPHVPKHVVKGKGLIRKDEDDEAIHYFMTILPRIKRRAHAVGNHGDYRGFACFEFTQNEGETVFIPNGWWHAVLNMTDTVGITQNFCSPRNFDQVWLKTRSGRKMMAYKWLCQLDEYYPHLAQRARAMNERDGFVMKYDPVEVKRRQVAKEQEERRRRDERLRRKEEELQRKGRHFMQAEARRKWEEEELARREMEIVQQEEQRRNAEMKRLSHSSSRSMNHQMNGSNGYSEMKRLSHSFSRNSATHQMNGSSSKRSRLDSRHVSP